MTITPFMSLENINPQPNNPLQSEEARTPLQKVGSFLKEGRQSRSISIEDLSKSLRIGQEQLEALENGQEDLLPEQVFIKAMVRRISEKLGLETTFVLKELQGREMIIKNLYEQKHPKPQKTDYKKLFPWMFISSGLLGLMSSILVINFFKSVTPSSTPNSNFFDQITYRA
tara:strand:+ start:12643 stop:13155 length:513 start_codon:yes stop_codon:yes gene_type:complete